MKLLSMEETEGDGESTALSHKPAAQLAGRQDCGKMQILIDWVLAAACGLQH